jgi:hypothetical protein
MHHDSMKVELARPMLLERARTVLTPVHAPSLKLPTLPGVS